MRAFPAALVLACALAGCASAGRTTGDTPRTSRNADVITAEEIAGASVQTAYEAVSRLRPRFLASQGSTTRSHVVQVVVDEVPRGDVSTLSSIRADNVLEIRYLSAADATMRWGSGYTGGAIVVRTLAGGR